MSDDYDLGLDAEEQDSDGTQEDQVEASADTQSAKLLKELKEVRKENQTLRSRSNEWLVEKFGQDIVNTIPAEVKAYEARLALAEKIHGLTNAKTEPTDQAAEASSQEEPSPEEKALAAVAKGPSAGQAPHGLSQDELIQLAVNDPGAYVRLKESGAVLERLPGSS